MVSKTHAGTMIDSSTYAALPLLLAVALAELSMQPYVEDILENPSRSWRFDQLSGQQEGRVIQTEA